MQPWTSGPKGGSFRKLAWRDAANILLAEIEEKYGLRCETKDYEDMPDLIDKNSFKGRCERCLMYQCLDYISEALTELEETENVTE